MYIVFIVLTCIIITENDSWMTYGRDTIYEMYRTKCIRIILGIPLQEYRRVKYLFFYSVSLLFIVRVSVSRQFATSVLLYCS